MKIFVGSLNPVKIEAVRKAFDHYFVNSEIYEFEVSSRVAKQPIGDEIFLGAENRNKALLGLNATSNLNADYFVSIESGIIELRHRWFNIDCACIMNKEQKITYGLSPAYCLDDNITKNLLQGKELGPLIDSLYGTNNIKQNGGAISLFSKGKTSRLEHCYQGVLMALMPFL
jgi:inosine/xanthosine triphosphatase